ncbi:MAG: hypothetical protein M1829_002079 [Trizodia sp. TS-e1964]|nr:MAG: hypothetical protein M1829_002079 [Trizodia sp. TS-e1964]
MAVPGQVFTFIFGCLFGYLTGVPCDQLPIVDLGYSYQQASGFNLKDQYYNFSNIRYAQPPIGSLRFAEPKSPEKKDPSLDNGLAGRICPQSSPTWPLSAALFLPKYLTGDPNATYSIATPVQLPQETEDCLFLDVMVPRTIYDNKSSGKGAPVLIWVHGGGYVGGFKNEANPAGLLSRSQGGLIFVAINYRLGAYGWLGGSTIQTGGVANAGLLDQHLAFRWVSENIHLFGGDPDRVTVMGQSAGGGSLMHHITSYGGAQPVYFQQAIVQSPGFVPVSQDTQENLFRKFLTYLKVSSLDEARQQPAKAIAAANVALVTGSGYGQYTFGPSIDGTFVPDQPGKLLLNATFAKNIKIMAGHNANEGLISTPQNAGNDTAFLTYLSSVFPKARPEVLYQIISVLYPPTYDGTLPYKNGIDRVALFISEAFYTCSTNFLAHAFGNATHNYLFDLPPGLHGQDVQYTFYNGPENAPDPSVGLSSEQLILSYNRVISPSVAVRLQRYISEFVKSGDPGSAGGTTFGSYGGDSRVLRLGLDSFVMIKDPTANDRCKWWQYALYE